MLYFFLKNLYLWYDILPLIWTFIHVKEFIFSLKVLINENMYNAVVQVEFIWRRNSVQVTTYTANLI